MPKVDLNRLVEQFEENPAAVMAAIGGLLMGVSKIIEATGNARGSHAYARDVNRRVRMSKKRK